MLSRSANSAHECTEECKKFPDLKEFLPPLKLLNSIPAQAQKLFKNINITFTCIDVCEEFIAVGSNVGIVYLFDQKKEKCHKLRCGVPENPITCVRLVVALECLVAVGSKDGNVAAFKIPFHEKDQVEKYMVQGLQKTSITSITWAKNGIKFFTGDSHGVVVCTEIEHLEHLSRSFIVIEEPSYIVQLSYHNMVLLVSTLHRSLLYHCNEKEIFQVGQKHRKYPGNFGAVFLQTEDSAVVYASRPGQRLWKSDDKGVIVETIILKNIIADHHHSIIFRREISNQDALKDFQFGSLKVFDGNFILSWTRECIVLVHPESGTLFSICGFADIVDVTVSQDEIYVLQGIRHLLRLSISEANWLNAEEATVEDIPLPIHKSSSEVLLSNLEAMQKSFTEDNPAPKFLSWVKRKFSDAPALENDENLEGSSRSERAHTVIGNLPDVVELDNNLATLRLFDDAAVTQKPTVSTNISDDIVYQPRAKKKKKKKHKVPVINVSSNDVEVSAVNSDLPDEVKRSPDPPDIAEINANAINSVEKPEADIKLEEIDCVRDLENNVQTQPKEINIVTLAAEQNVDNHNQSLQTESEVQDMNENSQDIDNDLQSNENDQIALESSHEEKPNEYPFDVTDIYSIPKRECSKTDEDNDDDVKFDTIDHCGKIDILEDDENDGMVSSSDSYRDIELGDPKLGSDWVQYKGPETIISLSISNQHVFCADNHNCLYVSNFPVLGLVWKKLMQPTEQISVSPSESIIWVLYKGTVYAMEKQSSYGSTQSRWTPFAQNVSSIAVYDDVGWYLSNGKFIVTKNLSPELPYGYPSAEIECTQDFIQLACHGKVVWALTSDYKVFCMSDSIYPKNKKLQEVKFPEIKSINMVTFGHDGTVYIVDAKNNVWFRTGVDCSMPMGDEGTWEVEKSSYIYECSSHLKSAVMRVVNKDLFSSLIYTQYPSIIAASEAGVWFCKQMDSNLYSNQKRIAGHRWDFMDSNGTVSAMKWSTIAVEGLVNNKGTMWSYTTNHELFCVTQKDGTMNLLNVDPPYGAVLKCIVPSYQCLWVLSSDGQIFVRQEISKKTPKGVWWHSLDITQLADSVLQHISCSKDCVWACDTIGLVYFRVGPLNPQSGSKLSQAWIEVDAGMDPPSPCIQKVYVSSCNPSIVWAIDSKRNVYARSGITSKLMIGDKWVLVPSPNAKQLCISKNTVWLLKVSGKIFRRFGITKSNCTGDYWKQIPGKLSHLSVTVDDDLWGVQNNELCRHLTKIIQFDNPTRKTSIAGKISDDDWEDVMADLSD